MKKILLVVAMCMSFGAFAQTSATANLDQNQQARSDATNAGNAQNIDITFAAAEQRAVDRSVNDSTVRYDYGTQVIKNTPSMGASNLTTSNDTCMGSSSGAISAPGVGVSLGTTWVDENCKRLKNGRELWNMGMKGAAVALMCEDAGNKKALELTGFVCPQSMSDEERAKAYNIKPRQVSAAPAPAQVAVTTSEDPYIKMSGRKLGQVQ